MEENNFIDFLTEKNVILLQKDRILIVDDDVPTRLGLKEVLEDKGYAVDIACDANKGMAVFEEKNPSLVIIDLIMPGMNGLDLCRQIRRYKILRQVKIILLTGYPSGENYLAAKRAGVDACVAKPVNSKMLIKRITQLLQPENKETTVIRSETDEKERNCFEYDEQ